MSWDVFLMRFDRIYATIADAPDETLPFGSRGVIEQGIAELFPGARFDAEGEGLWVSPVGFRWLASGEAGEDGSPPYAGFDQGRPFTSDVSIEFHPHYEDTTCNHLSLTARGNYTGPVVAGIVALAERLQCQAIDLVSSEFLDPADPAHAPRLWQEYRDRVRALRSKR